MSSAESHPSTTRKIAAARTRWAAIGAATAVTLGAGGLGIVGAADDGEAVYKPIQPCRMLDSRTADIGAYSTPIGAGETRTFEARGAVGECELPQDAVALSINLTSVDASTDTFFTAFPAGYARPNSSQLNPNDIIPVSTNGFDVTLSASGEFSVYNDSGTSHMFVDVLGVYTGTGPLVGPAGENGEDGANGTDGSDGRTLQAFYADRDGDTYGDPSVFEFAYETPDGFVTNKLDCDDSATDINPDGVESKFDGIDSNCDGEEGGGIVRASLDADGTEGAENSYLASISADGNLVAFQSAAANLVPDDTNGTEDVFVKNLSTGEITRVSVASDGAQANGRGSNGASISADGNFVAFYSDATNLVLGDTNQATDVFVKNLATGDITRASTADNGSESDSASREASISADGNLVAFRSDATNLVLGDTNSRTDVFVKNLTTSDITRVSVASDGTQANGYGSNGPSISADGNFVAFRSDANNLIPGDTNSRADVFVKNLTTGDITLVSVASDGTQSNGWVSDGASITADGNFVAFHSDANNLIPDDTNSRTDVFVKNLTTGDITRVSVASDGTQTTGNSEGAAISSDGRFVAFSSRADDLVDNDTNTSLDVFVKNLTDGSIVSVSANEYSGTGGDPTISADGRFVAWDSWNPGHVDDDNNDATDVFVADRGDTTAP